MHQKLIIVGNLGKDPEMRFIPSGQSVTSFSVATSHKYTNSAGEKISETTWFRINAWGKMGENCNQYLKKGSKVYIVGRLQADKATGGPRIWSKTDGTPGASFEVNASEVVFLSARADGGEQNEPPSGQSFENDGSVAPEDDIPF